MNIAHIGVGYWGKNILRNLINLQQELKNFNLKYIIDKDKDNILNFIYSNFKDNHEQILKNVIIKDDINEIIKDA
ncbi:MAG: hypothetical protein ACPL1F_07390, partial [bacterium]